MYNFIRFSFLILLCHWVSSAFSQTAEVRGFVYDKKSGEPVIFTSVYLQGTGYGAQTDVNGFYSITKVAVGQYTLFSTNIGYDTAQIRIDLKAGQKLNRNIFLNAIAVDLSAVDVSAVREDKVTEVNVSVNKITPKEIRQLPTVGGEPDLAQYLQVLPGVVFTGDQGGQLYIRGGSPVQNKVLLDGMVIYNPFHSIGLFSVFDTDVIRNVDVYSGGFNAEYGGRISAVMDITTRDGNKKRFSGKVSANPFTSKLLLEGPLTKYRENKGTSSFIFSARHSYLDQTSKVLYKYADAAGLPYNFTDLYSKLSFAGVTGSKINFFGFNFNDRVNYTAPAALKWNASGVGSNFVLVPAGSSVLVSGNFAYSNYRIELQEQTFSPRFSRIGGFNSGLEFTYFLGDDAVKYGFEVLGYTTDFKFTNASDITRTQNDNTTEIAGYLKYKLAAGKFLVDPSLRLHYHASLSEIAFEPRFGIKYLVSNNVRFKAAGGLYAQNLMAATSDRDVVNLFYGFISSPENLPRKFDGKDVESGLQKSQHIIAGVEIDFLKHFEINLEGYIKDFPQLTNINRDQIYPDKLENKDKPDYQKKDFIIERGTAKGVDLLLKYDYKKLYLWAVYSLGFVDRYDGIRSYSPHFDRRHNINMVSSYSFGKDAAWQLDVRWNLGSGFPFTQTQGFYEKINFDDGIGTDYTSQNGDMGILYGELNKGRLPYYHRLDVSVKKNWKLKENVTLEANAGATNLYNRKNIFYYDRITNDRKNQLPFLPSAGLSLTF